MSRASKLWILAAILAVPLWWAVNLYIQIHRPHPKGKVHTTQVLNYTGPLDASQSAVHVKVYKIVKLSTGVGDMQSIFDNRIEIDSASGHSEFRWPANTGGGFPGTDAAIRDLNGDGVKEIAVYHGDSVRVVTYKNGWIDFRPQADALDCEVYSVGPVKLKQDLVFVCGIPFPNLESSDYVFVPRLFSWAVDTGFYDVSNDHPDYYRTKLLPDLRSRMAEEKDGARKSLYRAAIQQLTNELQRHANGRGSQ